MANNRMWLLHRPTGLAFFLGKRMASSWYAYELGDICEFYDAVAKAMEDTDGWEGWDDFCLAMEDCKGAPEAFNDWRYMADDEKPRKLEVLKK